MQLRTEEEVKKWMRGLALLKKDLQMKIGFYHDLERIDRLAGNDKKNERYYREQIQRLQDKLHNLAADVERVLEALDPDERAVLTARYIQNYMWDAMEFHVYFSRRQAIRIHNRAIRRLVGTVVGEEAYHG